MPQKAWQQKGIFGRMNIELLAPAGNLEKLKIAVQYGADAIYIAGHSFSLRQGANNFSYHEIRSAIDFAHEHHCSVYITVNAFLHDTEEKDLIEYLNDLEKLKPDALICSDMGVIVLARKHTTIPIHVSTQSSVLNSEHAAIWKEMGVKRIVTGRELSIKEVASIKKKSGLEVEIFVHGAMCMAVSGHCSMSTIVAERDSNRGGCIQNCRFKYRLYENENLVSKSHLLSSKDLCGISLITACIENKIDSVKIEGRMKSNLYIASTVQAYAQVISQIRMGLYPEVDYWSSELKKLPHRGYTLGFLKSTAKLDSVFHLSGEINEGYKMAGTVLDIDNQRSRFAFHVRNKLKAGDNIEVLTFDGKIVNVPVPKIQNLADKTMIYAQPNQIIWLPLKEGIAPDNVARILIQANENSTK